MSEKISQMANPPLGVLSTDILPIVQTGVNYKATRENFLTARGGDQALLKNEVGEHMGILAGFLEIKLKLAQTQELMLIETKVCIEVSSTGDIFLRPFADDGVMRMENLHGTVAITATGVEITGDQVALQTGLGATLAINQGGGDVSIGGSGSIVGIAGLNNANYSGSVPDGITDALNRTNAALIGLLGGLIP